MAGELEPGVGAFQFGGRFGEFDLVGGRVDLEQQIALMNDGAVLETDLGQGAADLRAQLDLIDGRELAEKLLLDIEVTLQRRADGDGWRRRNGCLRCGRRQVSRHQRAAAENGQGDGCAEPGLQLGALAGDGLGSVWRSTVSMIASSGLGGLEAFPEITI